MYYLPYMYVCKKLLQNEWLSPIWHTNQSQKNTEILYQYITYCKKKNIILDK